MCLATHHHNIGHGKKNLNDLSVQLRLATGMCPLYRTASMCCLSEL